MNLSFSNVKFFFKNFNKFLFIFIFPFILFLGIILPPIFIKDQTLIFGGSTSVSLLFAKLNELRRDNFQIEQDVDYYYHSIGSASALKRVFDDTFYIGFLSRNVKREEIDYFANQNQEIINNLRIAKIAEDDIVFVYHLPESCTSNRLRLNLSWKNLKKIFSTENPLWNNITNVKCTKDEKIHRINRENGSGTRDVFNNKINVNDIKFDSQLGSTTLILDRVYNNPNTLSYISQVYLKEVLDWNRTKNIAVNFATLENIMPNKTNYSFQRAFYALYFEKNKDIIEDFIKFYESEAVKKKINDSGYRWNQWKGQKI